MCLLPGTTCIAAETAGQTYTNPIIDEIGPADPSVILHEGRYYLYCTGDNRSYYVYYSTDLVHWTKGPKVFQPGETNVWAPDVFRNPDDEKFYLYYTVSKRIGVAVADRPDATFADRRTLFKNAIDAHMFYDGGGRYFLYYVQLPGFRIHVQPMKTPLQKKWKPTEIIRPTEPWETKRGANKLWSVYHQQKDGSEPWNRFICIDPLSFNEKGILHGKATRGVPQPAPAEPGEATE